MPTVEQTTLLDQLNWRYAVKKFDPTRKVSPTDWNTLEQAVILAPSSFGLQPWKFFVVTSPEMKQKLRAASHGQPQITDCSHLVVFTVRKGVDAAHVDKYIRRISEVRGAPLPALDGFRNMMVGSIASQGPEQVDAWSSRQVYVALGFLIAAAAMLGIDACPMEGIEHAKYNEILGLSEQGLAAMCVAAVGYRAADDPAGKQKKVRFETKDVVTHIE
jgi:nitroreductase